MIRRLLVGLVLGFLVGGAMAAALVSGLKTATFLGSGGTLLAYLTAVVTGVVTGLVAGKPIWAAGAKIEAGLKAVFGALLAAGAMFALRQWAGGVTLDLSGIGAGGPAPLAELPAASLPLIAAVLGGLFELDNTGDGEPKQADGKGEARKRVAGPGARVAGDARNRVGAGEDADEAEAGPRRAKQ
jgi:hypothetical protein